MVTATFAMPASEFNAAWLAKIQPFLLDADTEVVVQVRRKTKRKRTNRSAPVMPPQEPNGQAAEGEVTGSVAKRYIFEPSPEDATLVMAEVTARSMRETLNVETLIREQNWVPIGQEEWDRLCAELNIEESAEELLALLTT